jgi:hypothetical protein
MHTARVHLAEATTRPNSPRATAERLAQDFVCAPRQSVARHRLQDGRWPSLNPPLTWPRAGEQVGGQLCKSRSGNRLSALSGGRGICDE